MSLAFNHSRRVLPWRLMPLAFRRLALRLTVPVLLASCATPIVAPPKLPAVDVSPVVAKPAPSALPEGWHHGAFMQIFVRAYQDSNGDGVGDLKGLTQRLDHLKELGVRGLWLMPITRSSDRDHGYGTQDFRAVEPDYGTLEDFDELIREAHARGIGVIMDYVLNHSAAEHPLFVQSRSGAKNPYRDWYVWAHDAPQGWDIWDKNPWYHAATQPWTWKGRWQDLPKPLPNAKDHYFGTFGGHMPDFNLRNPRVVDFHAHNLRFWLNRGLDGFRLDAVPHLIENNAKAWNDQPESRRLTALFVDEVLSYPNKYVVCEATAEPQAWGHPEVCGGAFAFGYVDHYVKAAKGEVASIRALAEYYKTALPTMATFLSNHDRFAGARLWDQVGGDVAAYKLAAAGYLLQPGTPFIYYGEEVGQGGVASLPGDDGLRAPMSWAAPGAADGFSKQGKPFRPLAPNAATHNVAQQREDQGSILSYYKELLKLRNDRPSIAQGRFDAPMVQRQVLSFVRTHGDERTLVVINYGRTRAEVEVAGLPRRARMAPIFPRRAGASYVAEITLADAAGKSVVALAPRSVRLFDIEAPVR